MLDVYSLLIYQLSDYHSHNNNNNNNKLVCSKPLFVEYSILAEAETLPDTESSKKLGCIVDFFILVVMFINFLWIIRSLQTMSHLPTIESSLKLRLIFMICRPSPGSRANRATTLFRFRGVWRGFESHHCRQIFIYQNHIYRMLGNAPKVELSKLIGRFCASWRKSKHFVFVATILASKQVYSFLIFKDTNHRQFLSFVALLVQTHRYFHFKMDRGVRMGPGQ